MEQNVWSDPAIYSLLKNEYVLISLYVDDNEKELPKEAQFTFLKDNGKTKEIKTIGDKWTTFQVINFKNASQPYYILMTPELEILNSPQQYSAVKNYQKWLEKGLKRFNKIDEI